MATITINEHWRIQSETLCWKLQEIYINKKGETDYYTRGYFGSLANALRALPEHAMRRSDAESIAELREEMNALSTAISVALAPMITLNLNGLSAGDDLK